MGEKGSRRAKKKWGRKNRIYSRDVFENVQRVTVGHR